MCIIAIKPEGAKFPSDERIKIMFENNHDGAGMMWSEEGKVHIRKGFMTIKDFMEFVNEWKKTHNPIKTPAIMHFRISTHAGVNKECTHPFPLSNQKEDLMSTELVTDIGIAHNGVIHNKPRYGYSDTMEYIATQLYYINKIDPEFDAHKTSRELIKNAIDSKMAFLHGDGTIHYIGGFYEDKKSGCKFSNESYKEIKKKVTHSYSDYWKNREWYKKYYNTGSTVNGEDFISSNPGISGATEPMKFMKIDYNTKIIYGSDKYNLWMGNDGNFYKLASDGWFDKSNAYATEIDGSPIAFDAKKARDGFHFKKKDVYDKIISK